MQVWRLTKARHAAAAFSGEGSRLFAARWNPAGVPMVYTSSSLSLAVVEVFVHLDAPEEPDFVSIAAELPVEAASLEEQRQDILKRLPADWRNIGNSVTQHIGAEWVAARRSLAMFVPSAVIEGEWNVLVNPAHSDAARIRLGQPKPFHFDSRMFKARG